MRGERESEGAKRESGGRAGEEQLTEGNKRDGIGTRQTKRKG